MEAYLAEFRKRLKPFEGSLVRPAQVSEPRAKHYLGWLAKRGAIDRIGWGWYYVPKAKPTNDAFDFLASDRNFKVVTAQSAASVWNGDFIHRDAVTVATDDASFARALQTYGERRGWPIQVEYNRDARDVPAKKVGNLRVESPEAVVVDCFQRWAFADGAATLNPDMPLDHMKQQSYWKRIKGTDVRIGQALDYVAHALFGHGTGARISDDYVREELDDAIARVRELG